MAQPEGTASDELALVKAFQEGQKELSELPESLQQKLLNGPSINTEGDQDDDADSQDEGNAEPVDSKQKADLQKPEAKKKRDKHKKPTPEEKSKVLLERANKINELEQEKRRHEHKMQNDAVYRAEYLKKFGINVAQSQTTDTEVDVWDEEFHKTTAKKLAETEARLAAFEAERQTAQLYRQLESSARKITGHTFQAPIAEMDTALKALEVKLGKAPDLEELEKIGFESDDVAMYGRLVEVQKLQYDKKLEDFETAWYVYEKINGPLSIDGDADDGDDSADSDPELTDRETRKAKMAKVMGHPSILSNQRAKTGDQGMTPAYAFKWLANHRDPDLFSEQDQKIYARIIQTPGLLR